MQPTSVEHEAAVVTHAPSAQRNLSEEHDVVDPQPAVETAHRPLGQRNGSVDGQPLVALHSLCAATHSPFQHLVGVAESQPLASVRPTSQRAESSTQRPLEQRV